MCLCCYLGGEICKFIAFALNTIKLRSDFAEISEHRIISSVEQVS